MARRSRFYFLLILAASALGALNQFFLKPLLGGTFPFLAWYANDVLAGFLILALTQLLLSLGTLPRLALAPSLLLVLLAGAAWELLPLLWKPTGVADPWDIPAYLAGGVFCSLLSRAEAKYVQNGSPSLGQTGLKGGNAMDPKHKRPGQDRPAQGLTDAEKPIPADIYPVLDTDLARDNLENDLPAADLEDL
ncbi:hypothetical protein AAEU42_02450 [Pseudoflavonifractor phocaeensis]|uniref:hypothetical protein n=1 Tax=Pseudoflavonifractor phocaeensis TaxID=1870988 RepID=UPI00313ED45B